METTETALTLITSALNKIGTYAAGEPISAADSSQSLEILNLMVDSWSNESLTTYAVSEQSTVLVPGQYQYTIGTGGNINATRPLRILESPGTCYVLDSNGNRYNLQVVDQSRWNLIGNIAAVTANFPNTLFYDPQYPLGIINVYPIPNISWTLYFDSYLQLTDFALLSSAMSLPPGYGKAIVDNLALELIPYFKPDGFNAPQLWVTQAQRSKANVKRTNIRDMVATYDSEIVSRASGTFNPYTYSNRGPF